MDAVRILEVKQSVFARNDQEADELRGELKQKKVFLLNLMSAPGSGKTTLLTQTLNRLKDELRIGVMEADIDSDVDAKKIATTGVKAIQLHTGGMCHLDAAMTRQGLEGLGVEGLDLAVLENVGNLVCPAEFDTGASRNAMILSVPEGDDKPLKYPLMFSICDVVLVNKIDVAPYFDFDLARCTEYVHMRNPRAAVLPVCAKTGEGLEPWLQWLRGQVAAWRAQRNSAAPRGACFRVKEASPMQGPLFPGAPTDPGLPMPYAPMPPDDAPDTPPDDGALFGALARDILPDRYAAAHRDDAAKSLSPLARMADEHESTDVLGSYTGMAQDGDPPVQDADDL